MIVVTDHPLRITLEIVWALAMKASWNELELQRPISKITWLPVDFLATINIDFPRAPKRIALKPWLQHKGSNVICHLSFLASISLHKSVCTCRLNMSFFFSSPSLSHSLPLPLSALSLSWFHVNFKQVYVMFMSLHSKKNKTCSCLLKLTWVQSPRYHCCEPSEFHCNEAMIAAKLRKISRVLNP